MQTVIHDFSVEQRIKQVTEEAGEGNCIVGEDITAGPEGATVIAEEVFLCRNKFSEGRIMITEAILHVEVIPITGLCKSDISY